ncbi:hypothetical protein Z042_17800 [Chania multitudinisentens RB-25]|uniref:Uncharacterized protein n=1 Tax=Chania multitudinisentens RB-25 TaxID=1441930 RepID=W0LKH5_9GAMM|nr:hypothetical protein [Chania multitudinisentens]AHG22899.1 hypothetical protein Z042_17800 [Chania multitudinisentens RB-25]
MKYFFNARLDNTRYRLAEGFLLCFGTPLVRPKITCQAMAGREQRTVGRLSVAPVAPHAEWDQKPPVAEAINRGQ